jgi:hypothetical protein
MGGVMESMMDREKKVGRGNGYVLSRDLNPKLVPISGFRRLGRNSRKHPHGQIREMAQGRPGGCWPVSAELKNHLHDPRQPVCSPITQAAARRRNDHRQATATDRRQ